MSDKPLPNGLVCIYAQLLPRLREVSRECGYALGLHGSMQRDLDIIAAPWTEDAISAKELVERLREEFGGYVIGGTGDGGTWTTEHGTSKPHGREAWSLCFGGKPFIDISVMPRGGEQ